LLCKIYKYCFFEKIENNKTRQKINVSIEWLEKTEGKIEQEIMPKPIKFKKILGNRKGE